MEKRRASFFARSNDVPPVTLPEFFTFDLADKDVERMFGWERVTVEPRSLRYKRSRSFGGPPTFSETWEYVVTTDDVVLHRLRASFVEDLWFTDCEVYEGEVLKADILRRGLAKIEHSEKKHPITAALTRSEEKILKDCEKIEAETRWHAVHGATKYAILSVDRPDGVWRSRMQEFKVSVERIRGDVKQLGAELDEYGLWVFRKGADVDEEKVSACRMIFNESTLRETYRLGSFLDWVEQAKICELLKLV